MTTQNALAFIDRCRREEDTRRRLATLPAPVALADLRDLGAELGLIFSEQELTEAFLVDWRMRQVRYAGRGGSDNRQ